MKKGAKRNQIISELLHVTDEEFTDEELIHQLIATEVTKNADKDEHMTYRNHPADVPRTQWRALRAVGRLFSVLSPSWSFGWS